MSSNPSTTQKQKQKKKNGKQQIFHKEKGNKREKTSGQNTITS
jgi:hypothetical protein